MLGRRSGGRDCVDEPIVDTDRFTVQALLGRGGMGAVHRAYDHERNQVVALKTLLRLSPDALLRFKREFRGLSDVVHPNLVTLYELLSFGESWCLTMELVDGCHYVRYVRPYGDGAADGTATTNTASLTAGEASFEPTAPTGLLSATQPRAPRPTGTLDLDRLHATLPQLAQAIAALHQAGYLHRDLKPSNILVTPRGRVVLLDFGIATEFGGGEEAGDRQHFAGTPAYVAPEMMAHPRRPPTPALDWYEFGVVLFVALTGRLPFQGSPEQMLELKQTRDAPDVTELAPECPRELARLCSRLLAREPEERPPPEEILAILGGSAPAPTAGAARRGADSDQSIVGREHHLAILRSAFEDSRRGAGVVTLVRGAPGMGKSALVETFLDEVATEAGALVLRGRCYEREQVPFKAIDGLVDALCHHLVRTEPDALIRAVTAAKADLGALTQAFPVLGRIGALVAGELPAAQLEPHELRRRAFRALRELFAALGATVPLVLYIDDLQWGDADSAPFLVDLARPPIPPLLLVATHRDHETSANPAIGLLHALREQHPVAARAIRELHVGRLSLTHASELARAQLAKLGAPLAAAETITRESNGNPFFLRQLVRFHSTTRGTDTRAANLTLEGVLAAQIDALTDDARALLNVIAVSGRPLPRSVALAATEIADAQRALTELTTHRMIRSTGFRKTDRVEFYHDRIREAATERLSPTALASIHGAIAIALEREQSADVEALAIHFSAAGDSDRALAYAVRAARAAMEALAFDRAARLFRLAIDHEPDAHAQLELWIQLGNALRSGGYGGQAARAYLHGASLADRAQALMLMTKAAAEFLRSGELDEGYGLLRETAAATGNSIPSSKPRAIASLLWLRSRIRARGLRFRERDERSLSPTELARLDFGWHASNGLISIDTVYGAEVHARHLLHALQAGEPTRAGRALVTEAAVCAMQNRAGRARAAKVLEQVAPLAANTHDGLFSAYFVSASALVAYSGGRWAEARNASHRGELLLRDQLGAAWELTTTQLIHTWALHYLGRVDELRDATERYLLDAQRRGELYAITGLSVGVQSLAGLAADEPHATRLSVERAHQAWTRDGFHIQHLWTLYSLAQCELYGGEGTAAFERMMRQWKAVERSLLLRMEVVRAETLHLRGRCALAAATQTTGASREKLLRSAARDMRAMLRDRMPWSTALARLLEAGLANLRGDPVGAATVLAGAAEALDAADMELHAAAARYRRARLCADDDAARDAAAAMQRCGVTSPEPLSATLVPGC